MTLSMRERLLHKADKGVRTTIIMLTIACILHYLLKMLRVSHVGIMVLPSCYIVYITQCILLLCSLSNIMFIYYYVVYFFMTFYSNATDNIILGWLNGQGFVKDLK